VDLRAILDGAEHPAFAGVRTSHHPACSESLYKLCSPDPKYGRRAVLNRIISINVFIHNQHTFCEKCYYFATYFDTELRSSSGHDDPISGSKLIAI
jgi:hypothetical protein